MDEVANRIGHSLQIALFFALPATLALFVISGDLISGLFGYGAFSQTDSQQAAYALMAYAVGLTAFVVNKVFQPVFFASSRGTFVLKISLLSVAINIVGSVTMMPTLGHIGLALATAISSWVAVVIMAVILLREKRLLMASLSQSLPIILASVIMMISLGATKWLMGPLWHGALLAPLIMTVIYVFVGLVVYFGISYGLGTIPPFLFGKRRLSRKA